MLLAFYLSGRAAEALVVGGVEVPHARVSTCHRAFDADDWPPRKEDWPFTTAELRPADTSNDQLFYIWPKFVQHAGKEAREGLTKFYGCVLPSQGEGDVLDICSSWTSHYPSGWRGRRCVALGLNPLELLANPSKTDFVVQNLNRIPQLEFVDNSFDLITCSLSVDYLTSPLEQFRELHRVLKPGGRACMAFTNRCYPSKVVPMWLKPFDDYRHCRIVGQYFHYSGGWEDLSVADVSPEGWTGARDPMYVVQARKAGA